MLSVLIIDRDEEFSSQLIDYFRKQEGFTIVGTATDGEKALNMITEFRPNIIILDPMLKKIEGSFLIKQIKSIDKDYSPTVYVLLSVSSNAYLEIYSQLNVDYISLKPVYPKVIVENLLQIMDKNKTDFVRDKNMGRHAVSKVIKDLGLSSNLLSSKQLVDILLMCLEDEKNLRNITTDLYYKVGAMYNTSHYAVERNIRSCIRRVEQADTELKKRLFQDISITNSLFLDTIVEYIRNDVY